MTSTLITVAPTGAESEKAAVPALPAGSRPGARHAWGERP